MTRLEVGRGVEAVQEQGLRLLTRSTRSKCFLSVAMNCSDSSSKMTNDKVILIITMLVLLEINDNQDICRQDAYGDIIMGYGARSRQVK